VPNPEEIADDDDTDGSADSASSFRLPSTSFNFGRRQGGLSGGSRSAGLNSFKSDFAVIPALYVQGGFGETVGTYLANQVNPYVGKPYVWGGKSPSAGGFDCSGLVHEILIPTMQAINTKAGGVVYDIAQMQRLLDQPAASQIEGIKNLTGGFTVNASNLDKIVPGMMLGIKRTNVPGFAQGRYEGISHIGVVTIHNGQICVAESANNGTQFVPLNKWLMDPSIGTVYAVNPLIPTTDQGKQLLARVFNNDDPTAPKTTVTADASAPKINIIPSSSRAPNTGAKPAGEIRQTPSVIAGLLAPKTAPTPPIG
jgi:hypothetical protein